jgi:hypothetical protein
MEAANLGHEIFHTMQVMSEVSLVLFGFMVLMFVIYLVLGKI